MIVRNNKKTISTAISKCFGYLMRYVRNVHRKKVNKIKPFVFFLNAVSLVENVIKCKLYIDRNYNIIPH